MSNRYGPRIVTDGLVLCLDAADRNSYPGSGSTWYDLSGNNRHYAITSNVVTFNSEGFFSVGYYSGHSFTGPASNAFGFSSTMEHTIMSFADITVLDGSNFFHWYASPNTGTDTRGIFSHCPWGNYFYYDVAGCCTGTQRMASATLGGTLTSGLYHCLTWRTRKDSTPNREFFDNGVSVLNSANNSTATATWDMDNPAGLAAKWRGKLGNFIVYNRALSNTEILQNYHALKGRFGL